MAAEIKLTDVPICPFCDRANWCDVTDGLPPVATAVLLYDAIRRRAVEAELQMNGTTPYWWIARGAVTSPLDSAQVWMPMPEL